MSASPGYSAPSAVKHWIRFSLFVVLAYLCIAMFNTPAPAGTGLDPSWKVALTQAAVHHLVFGRAIIFTYGPLGFLFAGAAMPPLTLAISFFRIANILAFFAIIAWRLCSEERPAAQVALVLGAGIAGISLSSLSPDSITLFSFLAYVTSQRFSFAWDRRLAALTLGLLTAFAIITTFTLFIDIAGCSFIVFAVALFDKSRERQCDAQALAIYSFTTSICGQLLFLAFLVPANVPIAVGTIAAAALGAWVLGHRPWPITSRFKSQLIVLVALLIAFGTPFIDTPFRIYIYTSLQVALGYSSAMVIEGPLAQTLIAVAELVALVIVSLTAKNRLSMAVSLAICYVLWASFKHGFVRQDGHVLIFFAAAAFVSALLTVSSAGRQMMVRAALMSALSITVLATQLPPVFGVDFFEQLEPKTTFGNFASAIKALGDAGASASASDAALQADKLPASLTAMIGSATTAVLPWEQSLIFANGLNWKPAPVLQSYSAYTQTLDHIDRDWFRREGAKVILFSYTDIDGRYLFADQPSTYHYVMCHYAFAGYAPFDGDAQGMLLTRKGGSRCQPLGQEAEESYAWNDVVPVPQIKGAQFILANIHIDDNILGRVAQFAFRAPVVTMDVAYSDGTAATFRIEPETSGDGILLNPLPRNSGDAAEFLKTGTGPTVESVRFHSTGEALMKPTLHVRFMRGLFTRLVP